MRLSSSNSNDSYCFGVELLSGLQMGFAIEPLEEKGKARERTVAFWKVTFRLPGLYAACRDGRRQALSTVSECSVRKQFPQTVRQQFVFFMIYPSLEPVLGYGC